MDLASALAGVVGYDHTRGKYQPAQQHLLHIRNEAPPEIPVGLKIRVSGSAQSLPVIPWISLLDPDVTRTATEGLYIVYLYDAAIASVYLSMNQGATQHRRNAERYGLTGVRAEQRALEEITEETASIRALLGPGLLSGTTSTISLNGSTFLPMAYEHGNIVAILYTLESLPSSAELAAELQAFTAIYQRCVEIKDSLAANQRVRTSARSNRAGHGLEVIPEFRPKDSADYFANVAAATQQRTRKHEALVKEFGEGVRDTGRTPVTNVHPRDLVIIDSGREWLVEAKTVGVNAEPAVRDAVGQLLTYRHFYYRRRGRNDPRLLALFNAPIGPAFEALLHSLDIECVYRDATTWRGSTNGLRLLS